MSLPLSKRHQEALDAIHNRAIFSDRPLELLADAGYQLNGGGDCDQEQVQNNRAAIEAILAYLYLRLEMK